MIWILVAIASTILYCFIFYLENCGSKHRAPGPIRIPPFGNLIQIALKHKVAYVALHELAKKYGDVMSIKLGLTETIVLSSADTVRKVFAKEEATGRHLDPFFNDRNLRQNIGLIFIDGPESAESRSFCRESLRNHGFGNREAMTNLFLGEMTQFFKHLDDESQSAAGNRIHIDSDYFHGIFFNVMLTLLIGNRLDYNEPILKSLLQYQRDVFRNGVLGAGIMMAYPSLTYIFPEMLGYNIRMKGNRGFHEIALAFLKERKKENYRQNPRCFTDEFLKKMEEEDSMSRRTYTEDHFAVVFTDLLQAATDTISNIMNFVLVNLILAPQVQEKLYTEIKTVIGRDRNFTLENKANLHYTQAVILEAHRWSRSAIFGIPKMALGDFTYRGYLIKMGTILMMNEHSIFFDETYWGDPNVFRPERFIGPDGMLDAAKSDKIIGFGAGKRSCFGEAQARDMMLTFVTSLYQRYKFSHSPGDKPSPEPVLAGSLYVAPYHAIVTHRNK